MIWSAMAWSASKSDTSNGSDGTPTIATVGFAPVNLDRSRTSRLAVDARSACMRSAATAKAPARASSESAVFSSSAAASAAFSGFKADSVGWVRLSIKPASGMCSVDNRSMKKDASRNASGSAADTTTNWVPRRLSNS